MASLQMTKPSPIQEPQKPQTSCVSSTNGNVGTSTEMGMSLPEKRPVVAEQEAEANWVVKKVKVESSQQFIKPLEDDHIEQMIQELIHYGSIELCSSSVM